MRILLSFFLLLSCLSAQAVDLITATITVTNAPANNDTITVNGDVRTWKTTVVTPATQIAVTNVVGYAATNLFNQAAANLYSGPLKLSYSGTNGIKLIANSGNALVVTASGTWATVTMGTQLVTSLTMLRWPISGEPSPTVRTNATSDLVESIGIYASNSFPAGAVALSNHVNLSAAQTITGAKTFNGAITLSNSTQTIVGGYATNLSLINITTANGTLGNLTNGTFTNPSLTNGQNFGNAFRSPGTGDFSEQFGTDAEASGDYSVALGNGAVAGDFESVAIGTSATVTGSEGATAIGVGATILGGFSSVALGKQASVGVNGFQGTAIGFASEANGWYSVALGTTAVSAHTNSAAIGANALTTAENQIRLGTVTEHVSIPGNLRVEGSITNINAVGTNTIDGDISFIRRNLSSLANGVNSISASSNAYLKVSGPSGAFSINGIAGGKDGRMIFIQNSTGFTLTISQDSGSEPVAANRIYTGTGSDITQSNPHGFVTLVYDSALSRWVVVSKN